MTRRALLAACALAALAVPQALAATARNGAPIDPKNLIADDLEAEALASYARNAGKAPFKGHEIVVVDYRLPSSARRLYIVDLDTGAVEPHYVAHGRGSDPGHTQVAMRFGDTEGSGMTSIGAYRGLDRYQSPAHGPALRLAGLDRSNASAYERLIVVHTAPYFDPANGKFGRSLGCFVVTVEDRSRVYDVIAEGGFLYAGPVCLGSGGCRKPETLMASAPEAAPAVERAVYTPAPAPAAKPAAPPVVLASYAPPPSVAADPGPAPRAKPRLAPVVVAAVFTPPEPRAKPVFDTEEQLAAARRILAGVRPVHAGPVLTAGLAEAPLPRAKPDFAAAPTAVALAGDVPVPVLKPSLAAAETAPEAAPAPVLAADAPQPRAKPGSLEAPRLMAADVPVPAPKPAGLRRMADASDTIRR